MPVRMGVALLAARYLLLDPQVLPGWSRSLVVVITVGEAASRVGRSPKTVRR